MKFSYKVQEEARGIAEAFIIGENFIKNDNVCLVLGDNLFYGQGFTSLLEEAGTLEDGACIFAYKSINISDRGEFEIADINRVYFERGKLKVKVLGRGFAWLDTGTHDSLLEANNLVQAMQKRQGLYIACIEEIAYRKGFIGKEQLYLLAQSLMSTEYGKYLMMTYEE